MLEEDIVKHPRVFFAGVVCRRLALQFNGPRRENPPDLHGLNHAGHAGDKRPVKEKWRLKLQ